MNIEFRDDDFSKEVFEILYESIIFWGNLRNEKGRTILAREDHNLLRLEEISKECECGKTLLKKEPARELNFSGSFALTEKDREFFVEYISNTPWGAGKGARKALKVLKFIEELKNESESSKGTEKGSSNLRGSTH